MKISAHHFYSAAVTGVLILAMADTVHACGESRFRLGHGIRYEAYQAPMPAQLLVYAGSGQEAITEELEAVGHQVTVVDDPTKLAAALDNSGYDIVIAPYGEMGTVEQYITEVPLQPDLLPVVSGGSAQKRAAKNKYSNYLSSKYNLRKYARTIHRVMEARGR